MKKLFARSRPSEIQGLQFVRANAVLLVVLCHAAAVLGLPEYFDNEFLGGVLSKGAVGVDIFFVLSGFIIVHVALKKTTLEAKTPPGEFLLKRAIRILPFLWIAVFAYAVARYIGAREFEWLPYFNAMVLFPIGELRPNVVWSLRHEALFYIVFAVAFLSRKRMPYLLYAWCVAPVVVWFLAEVADLQMPSGELFAFVFNRANAMFGCGVLVGIVCKRYGLPRSPLNLRPALVWLILGAATLAAFIVRDSVSAVAVAVAASTAVVAGLLTPNADSPFARAWEMLGDASFSIYLTHNMFLLLAGAVWVRLFGAVGFELAIFALGVLAVIGGVIVHFVVEKPVISLMRRLIFRPRVRELVAKP